MQHHLLQSATMHAHDWQVGQFATVLQSQGDARSMADYLAQANANLEGRVEELFKMMQEIMSSEQGITDLELLSVIRSLREENVRLLKERQQVRISCCTTRILKYCGSTSTASFSTM